MDASNLEPLLWTATKLGLERLAAGCAQYLLSRDVIAAAPAQVRVHSIAVCPCLCLSHTADCGQCMCTKLSWHRLQGRPYLRERTTMRPMTLP